VAIARGPRRILERAAAPALAGRPAAPRRRCDDHPGARAVRAERAGPSRRRRRQQKKQKDLETKLKKGDRVVTSSGLVGKVAELGDGRYFKLEIAPGVKVQMLRSAIAGIEADGGETAKAKGETAPASDKK
jgi:preprotein translocase YajC subunit